MNKLKLVFKIPKNIDPNGKYLVIQNQTTGVVFLWNNTERSRACMHQYSGIEDLKSQFDGTSICPKCSPVNSGNTPKSSLIKSNEKSIIRGSFSRIMSNNSEICEPNFILIRQIDSGAFGIVYEIYNKDVRKHRAIKITKQKAK